AEGCTPPGQTAAMTTRFLKSRTTVGVRDVAASIDFYRRALGFELLVSMGDPPDFALLEDPASGVGLGVVLSEDPPVAPFACCYVDVDGVDELHARCVDAGARITAPPTRQPWGNYDFVIADPDGHQLAFGEVPTRPA